MPDLSFREIADAIGGDIYNFSKDFIISDFQFDSRNIVEKPTLFFALNSDSGDGHKYVPDLKRSDVGAVVNNDFDKNLTNIPLISVDNTLSAAHKLASFIRSKFSKIRYIGVTGSAGKTTTKEFIAELLSEKFKVFRSFENWNNWIGMPFSLMGIDGDEDFAVFELAMSYPGIGEIDLLAEILRPDIAIILNVFPVHMEFLKTLENVAKGKIEILNYLDSDSIAFVSGDSDHILDAAQGKKGRIIFFGRDYEKNNIVLDKIERGKTGSVITADFFGIESDFNTSLINSVHLENLFPAILTAQNCGMKNWEIQKAIKNIKPISNRGAVKKLGNFTVIDETYNSNPIALEKTLKWVDSEYSEKKIAVIGDMLELGELEDSFHSKAGKYFASLDYSRLVTVGIRAKKIAEGASQEGFPEAHINSFENAVEAGKFLKNFNSEKYVILFKASRGIALENAMKELDNE